MEDKTLLQNKALSKFFEDAYIGVHWVSKDGIIIQANQAELDLLGYRKEEYIGHHIGEFYVAQSDIENLLSSLVHGIELRQWPARMRRRDGTIANVILTATPCFEDRQVVNSICFTRDVTVQNGAGILQEQLASIVETSEDAIISKSLKGIILTWNTGAERIFGYSANEAIGQSINLIIPPERQNEEFNILEQLRHGKRVEHYETVRVGKSGEKGRYFSHGFADTECIRRNNLRLQGCT